MHKKDLRVSSLDFRMNRTVLIPYIALAAGKAEKGAGDEM